MKGLRIVSLPYRQSPTVTWGNVVVVVFVLFFFGSFFRGLRECECVPHVQHDF